MTHGYHTAVTDHHIVVLVERQMKRKLRPPERAKTRALWRASIQRTVDDIAATLEVDQVLGSPSPT